METCYFIHPENIKKSIKQLNVDIAVIARPDWFLENNEFKHIIVETPEGIHSRFYLSSYQGINFLIIYGRFNRIRTTSYDIDFISTQKTLNFLGVKKVIGTFVAGSIKKDIRAGEVFIPHDFVGLGGYNQSVNLNSGFRNVDMLNPFCVNLRNCIIESLNLIDFNVKTKAIYASFHHFPRIETQAELEYYESQNWDIIGQTLDPEATLARESGIHYASIVATIDDRNIRSKFLENDKSARLEIDKNIIEGRKKTFEIFLKSLHKIDNMKSNLCNCQEQKNTIKNKSANFFYRPKILFEDLYE